MIIFSASPMNQLPNHGRNASDKFCVHPRKQLTTTSDCSSVFHSFSAEPAAQLGSEGRCLVLQEAAVRHLGQQLGVPALHCGTSRPTTV